MSQLPAGVVQINRENYLLVTTVKDLVPQTSKLVKANPAQGNWPTIPQSLRDATYEGGRQSQISGYYDPIPKPDSPSGWVYIVANNFDPSGPAVLSYFNVSTGNMETRAAADPTGLAAAPVTTVVSAGTWPDPAEDLPAPEDNRLAQPYGGFISPGSTLDELRVFISQWNTGPGDNSPYPVIQFAGNPLKLWA